MNEIPEQSDLQEEKMKEKVLTFPAKYRGTLTGFHGREEERLMRNEWD